eukprot:COSAG02_NODE_109_length_36250_cov_121.168903_19_plen_1642_part_00
MEEPPPGLSKLEELKWKKAQRAKAGVGGSEGGGTKAKVKATAKASSSNDGSGTALERQKAKKKAERQAKAKARPLKEHGDSEDGPAKPKRKPKNDKPAKSSTSAAADPEPPPGMSKLEQLKWKKAQKEAQQDEEEVPETKPKSKSKSASKSEPEPDTEPDTGPGPAPQPEPEPEPPPAADGKKSTREKGSKKSKEKKEKKGKKAANGEDQPKVSPEKKGAKKTKKKKKKPDAPPAEDDPSPPGESELQADKSNSTSSRGKKKQIAKDKEAATLKAEADRDAAGAAAEDEASGAVRAEEESTASEEKEPDEGEEGELAAPAAEAKGDEEETVAEAAAAATAEQARAQAAKEEEEEARIVAEKAEAERLASEEATAEALAVAQKESEEAAAAAAATAKEEAEAAAAEEVAAVEEAEAVAAEAAANKERQDVVEAERMLTEKTASGNADEIAQAEADLARERAEAEAAQTAAERERAEADEAQAVAQRERREAEDAKQVEAKKQQEAAEALANLVAQEAEARRKAELEAAEAQEKARALMETKHHSGAQLIEPAPEPEPEFALSQRDETMEPVSAETEEQAMVRRAFESVDADQSGHLDRTEVRTLTQILGRNISEQELTQMMDEMGGSNGSEIDFPKFYAWWMKADGVRSGGASSNAGEMKATLQAMGEITRADVQEAFDAVDVDKSGSLDRHEVRQLSESLGRPVDDTELAKMMDTMDADGSGEVNFHEFYVWFAQVGDGPGGSKAASEIKQTLKDRKKQEKKLLKAKKKEEQRLEKQRKKDAKKKGGASGLLGAFRSVDFASEPGTSSPVAEVDAALHSGGEGVSGNFGLVDSCLKKHAESTDPYISRALPRLQEMRGHMIAAAKRELQEAVQWDDPQAIRAHAQHLCTIFGMELIGDEIAAIGQRCTDLNDQAALRMHSLLSSASYPDICTALIEFEGFEDGQAAQMWEQLFQRKRWLQDQINDQVVAARESSDAGTVMALLQACVPFGDQVDLTSREQLEQRLLYLIRAPSIEQGTGGHGSATVLASRGMTTHEVRMAQHTATEVFAQSQREAGADGLLYPVQPNTTHVAVEEFEELYSRLKFSIAERRSLEVALQQARLQEWTGVVEQRRLRSELHQEQQQNEQLRRLVERKLSKLGLPASITLRELQEGTGDVAAVARSLSLPLERQLAQLRAEAHRAVRQAVASTERRMGAQYSAREATLRAELASLTATVEESKAALARTRVAGSGHGVAAAAHAAEQDRTSPDGSGAVAAEGVQDQLSLSNDRRSRRGKKSKIKLISAKTNGSPRTSSIAPSSHAQDQSEEVIHRLLQSEKRLREEMWVTKGRHSSSSSPHGGTSSTGYGQHAEEMSAIQELQQALADVSHWQGLYARATTQLKEVKAALEVRDTEATHVAELSAVNEELLQECAQLRKEIDEHDDTQAVAARAQQRQEEIQMATRPLPAATAPPVAPRPVIAATQVSSGRWGQVQSVAHAGSYIQHHQQERQQREQNQRAEQTMRQRPAYATTIIARSPTRQRPTTPPLPGSNDQPPPVAPRPSLTARPYGSSPSSSVPAHAWRASARSVSHVTGAMSAMGYPHVQQQQQQQQQHEQHQQLRGPQTSLHSTSSAPVVRDRPQQWQHNPLDYGEVEEPTSTRWK